MRMSGKNHEGLMLLLKPLSFIVLLACLSIGAFLTVSQHYMKALFDRVEERQRDGLVQIISIARNAMEPLLSEVRSGKLPREEAISRIRELVRHMTYTDEYGKNYIVMNSYDGINLVHPFEPERELKSDLDLQDVNGRYIVRELLAAAKTHPEGSFLRYVYYLPDIYANQEKITYVIGIPEIECYIATGMYMQQSIIEQREILTKVKHASIWLLLAALIPISVIDFFHFEPEPALIAESEIRKKAEEKEKQSRKFLNDLLQASSEFAITATHPNGLIAIFNHAAEQLLGYASEEVVGKCTPEIFHIASEIQDREKRAQCRAGLSRERVSGFFGKTGSGNFRDPRVDLCS